MQVFDSLRHISLLKAQVSPTWKAIVTGLSKKNSFRYKSYVKFYIEFNRFDDDLYVYEYHMFLSPYWFLWNAWRNKHQNNV